MAVVVDVPAPDALREDGDRIDGRGNVEGEVGHGVGLAEARRIVAEDARGPERPPRGHIDDEVGVDRADEAPAVRRRASRSRGRAKSLRVSAGQVLTETRSPSRGSSSTRRSRRESIQVQPRASMASMPKPRRAALTPAASWRKLARAKARKRAAVAAIVAVDFELEGRMEIASLIAALIPRSGRRGLPPGDRGSSMP